LLLFRQRDLCAVQLDLLLDELFVAHVGVLLGVAAIGLATFGEPFLHYQAAFFFSFQAAVVGVLNTLIWNK
jgi:hypothetical protein